MYRKVTRSRVLWYRKCNAVGSQSIAMCMALELTPSPNKRFGFGWNFAASVFKLGDELSNKHHNKSVRIFVSESNSFFGFFQVKSLNLLDEESIPSNNGNSLHGISQPRQNLDQGHSAHILPPSATALKINGNSYPKLSSLEMERKETAKVNNSQVEEIKRKSFKHLPICSMIRLFRRRWWQRTQKSSNLHPNGTIQIFVSAMLVARN